MSWLLLVAVARADTCAAYHPPERITVADAPVDESSGVAASRSRPGVFFTHGDAGGDPLLYAFDLDGRYLGSHVVRGAALIDWEDVAAGPCPRDGGDCLYVGDIGDNDLARPAIQVYVVEEPADGGDARAVDVWDATYPDGPHDAEALLVHPCTGDVYVVTKADEGPGTLYRFPADRSGDVVLERILELHLPDGAPITGGSFDADGDRVVLRTADRVWAWEVSPDDPERHWDFAPVEAGAVDEAQGEGVTFTLDGALVTTDEGHPLHVHVLDCASPEAAVGECAFEPVGGGGCGCATTGRSGWPALAALAALATRRRRTPTWRTR